MRLENFNALIGVAVLCAVLTHNPLQLELIDALVELVMSTNTLIVLGVVVTIRCCNLYFMLLRRKARSPGVREPTDAYTDARPYETTTTRRKPSALAEYLVFLSAPKQWVMPEPDTSPDYVELTPEIYAKMTPEEQWLLWQEYDRELKREIDMYREQDRQRQRQQRQQKQQSQQQKQQQQQQQRRQQQKQYNEQKRQKEQEVFLRRKQKREQRRHQEEQQGEQRRQQEQQQGEQRRQHEERQREQRRQQEEHQRRQQERKEQEDRQLQLLERARLQIKEEQEQRQQRSDDNTFQCCEHTFKSEQEFAQHTSAEHPNLGLQMRLLQLQQLKRRRAARMNENASK